jgi:hypothetical protein
MRFHVRLKDTELLVLSIAGARAKVSIKGRSFQVAGFPIACRRWKDVIVSFDRKEDAAANGNTGTSSRRRG